MTLIRRLAPSVAAVFQAGKPGGGSGVIIDPRGYVLTNNHVVEGATELVVRLDDDRELDAVVVGRDPKTDLAVIEIEAEGLSAAALANSDDLRAIIYRNGKVAELREQALKEGMLTLKQDGIRKVLQGFSDISEIRRVCIK